MQIYPQFVASLNKVYVACLDVRLRIVIQTPVVLGSEELSNEFHLESLFNIHGHTNQKCDLKTLFNIVEAPFKKLLNFYLCVV